MHHICWTCHCFVVCEILQTTRVQHLNAAFCPLLLLVALPGFSASGTLVFSTWVIQVFSHVLEKTDSVKQVWTRWTEDDEDEVIAGRETWFEWEFDLQRCDSYVIKGVHIRLTGAVKIRPNPLVPLCSCELFIKNITWQKCHSLSALLSYQQSACFTLQGHLRPVFVIGFQKQARPFSLL